MVEMLKYIGQTLKLQKGNDYMTNIEEIVDSKELREQYINRVEVLDKVKAIMLIPQMEMLTTRQVADYYEVPIETIKAITRQHKDELGSDGMTMVKLRDFGEKLSRVLHTFQTGRGTTTIELNNGVTLLIPNGGIYCFPKRAVLRFGMLLRDSEIAKEVRTQLLNVVEKVEEIAPEIFVFDIEKEKELTYRVGLACSSGDFEEYHKAQMELNAYRNRYERHLETQNTELHKENKQLTDQNKLLTDDNNILAGDILAWSNRASANKIVRLMATNLDWKFGKAWKEVYDQLSYRHGISLAMRWAHDGKPKNKPLLSYLHDDEWAKFYKTVAAMLQARYVNPSKIFAQARVELKESD